MDRIVENIEEVALAVEHQDEAVALFEELFGLEFKETRMVTRDNMKVKCARVGDTEFHIVAATTLDSVIAKFIQDKGEGIHHIAFRVSNLDKIVTRLREKGVRLVPEEPLRGRQASSRSIFVHPKSVYGVLIQLMEIPKPRLLD